jgi:hypothetical protein
MGSSVPHAAPRASLPDTISMPAGNENEKLCPLCHNVKPATNSTVTAIKSPDESVIETSDNIEDFGQLEINPSDSDDVVKFDEDALMSDEIKPEMISNLDLPDGSATDETSVVEANSNRETASDGDVKENDELSGSKKEEVVAASVDEATKTADKEEGDVWIPL